MTLRTILSACIAIGMHSSVCTGGFFAITAAIADQAAYSQSTDGPMSYGAIGYLSCKSTAKSTDVRSAQEPGCEDAKTCISRVSATLKNSLFIPVDALVYVVLPTEVAYETPEYFVPKNALARAGPLFEDSITFAKHTEKLE